VRDSLSVHANSRHAHIRVAGHRIVPLEAQTLAFACGFYAFLHIGCGFSQAVIAQFFVIDSAHLGCTQLAFDTGYAK
jgi:hypothetical protein